MNESEEERFFNEVMREELETSLEYSEFNRMFNAIFGEKNASTGETQPSA